MRYYDSQLARWLGVLLVHLLPAHLSTIMSFACTSTAFTGLQLAPQKGAAAARPRTVVTQVRSPLTRSTYIPDVPLSKTSTTEPYRQQFPPTCTIPLTPLPTQHPCASPSGSTAHSASALRPERRLGARGRDVQFASRNTAIGQLASDPCVAVAPTSLGATRQAGSLQEEGRRPAAAP
jgi:hypothetical protein